MSSKNEELQLPIVEAPAAVENAHEDTFVCKAVQASCFIKLPQSPIQFSLSTLPDDGEAMATSVSICGKAKWPRQKKSFLQLKKFFYPRFKRRPCGIITLESKLCSVKQKHKNASCLQVACIAENSAGRIHRNLQQMSSINKASGSANEVLVADVVNCESPSNFVRYGKASALADKAYSPKLCAATPMPMDSNAAFRSTESPCLGDIPHLCFASVKEKQSTSAPLLSRFVSSPCTKRVADVKKTHNLESVLCNNMGNVILNSSNLKEPHLSKSGLWVDGHDKENVPLVLKSNSKAVIVYQSLKKKRRKKLIAEQALSTRQVSHGFLKTRSASRLEVEICSREVKLGPVLRSAQNYQSLNIGFKREKIIKERSLSAYGSKKTIVKALLEKYLRNRRLKCGTPSRREVCLPFLNREAGRRVECFYCKACVVPHEMTVCSHKNCKRSYHRSCAQSLENFQFFKNGDTVCPQHVCMVCKGFYKFKVFRCERCTMAAHKKCFAFPEHAAFLDSKPNYFVCWRHPLDWRLESEYKVPTTDTKEVFKRLPIPYAPIEFSIGTELPEEVSGKGLEPTPFIQIRRNIFLVKKKRDNTDEGVGCSCNDHCHNGCECRAQSMSCSKSCNCNEKCANKPFRREKKIKLVKTLACGWGVQSNETIAQGEFIIEYVGEVINEAMCEERLWTLKERGDQNFYMCEIGKDFIIDATFKGNLSRFVNHSCDPNCILEKWRVDGEIRVGIFAIKEIKDGEPLTYDYRFIQFGPTVRCCCGTSMCRGNLGESYQNKRSKQASGDLTSFSGSFDIPSWGERQKRSQKNPELPSITHTLCVSHPPQESG